MRRHLHPTEGSFARALHAEVERAHAAVVAEHQARLQRWMDDHLANPQGLKAFLKEGTYRDLEPEKERKATMSWPMDSEGREIPQDEL